MVASNCSNNTIKGITSFVTRMNLWSTHGGITKWCNNQIDVPTCLGNWSSFPECHQLTCRSLWESKEIKLKSANYKFVTKPHYMCMYEQVTVLIMYSTWPKLWLNTQKSEVLSIKGAKSDTNVMHHCGLILSLHTWINLRMHSSLICLLKIVLKLHTTWCIWLALVRPRVSLIKIRYITGTHVITIVCHCLLAKSK